MLRFQSTDQAQPRRSQFLDELRHFIWFPTVIAQYDYAAVIKRCARRMAAPQALQTQRARFGALLLEIAVYAEEWLTSAQAMGLAGRRTCGRVMPWDRSAPQ